MRISRLQTSVLCEALGCEETALFLLVEAFTFPDGKSMVAYCERHTGEFTSVRKDAQASTDRLTSSKADVRAVRKTAS
jgi:hypothetical protein